MALHQAAGLQLVHALLVRVELLLQLRYHLGALLILFLEDGFDAFDLLLVGVSCQLKVLVDIV